MATIINNVKPTNNFLKKLRRYPYPKIKSPLTKRAMRTIPDTIIAKIRLETLTKSPKLINNRMVNMLTINDIKIPVIGELMNLRCFMRYLHNHRNTLRVDH